MIMLGDFNATFDNRLDRKLFNIGFRQYIHSLGLVDVWRHKHATEHKLTFDSAQHETHTRTDIFLISERLLVEVGKVIIGNHPLSDHAPVTLEWITGPKKMKSAWRLNTF